jgi:O-methyltransferase
MRFEGIAKYLRQIAESRAAARLIEVIDLRSENRMREFGMLAHAFEFKRINNVPGDYFEFGLWRGKTFRFAHRLKRRYRLDGVKLWGFDSFAGLPAIDDPLNNVWSEGQFACSEDEFRYLLKRCGVRESEYELVKGFYETSLNDDLHERMAGLHAATVYIDCDLYSSTLQVLQFIKRYLVDGSVICFDEYWGYRGSPNQGEQRAVREFLAENQDLTFIPWLDFAPLGKSFIVNFGNRVSRQETKEQAFV